MQTAQIDSESQGLSPDIDQWLRERETLSPLRLDSLPSTSAPQRLGDVTQKEMQVLEMLARGNTNAAIARHLFVSESTVRTHLRSINCKLRAANRTQAVAVARRLGLVA